MAVMVDVVVVAVETTRLRRDARHDDRRGDRALCSATSSCRSGNSSPLSGRGGRVGQAFAIPSASAAAAAPGAGDACHDPGPSSPRDDECPASRVAGIRVGVAGAQVHVAEVFGVAVFGVTRRRSGCRDRRTRCLHRRCPTRRCRAGSTRDSLPAASRSRLSVHRPGPGRRRQRRTVHRLERSAFAVHRQGRFFVGIARRPVIARWAGFARRTGIARRSRGERRRWSSRPRPRAGRSGRGFDQAISAQSSFVG